uniref:Mannose receptor C-type 1 n=1 Tax=Salarias fasciatus TaxID=181472 RepID=A0A672FZD2_SALFA
PLHPLTCIITALLAVLLGDSGTFLIFNVDHNKCVRVEGPTSLTAGPCNPRAKDQQFRWASESRILSISHKLCLGATEIKNWVKVALFECDENNILQHWQCKNDTLFGLKDEDLHLNYGNFLERSIMIYKGSGVWSRWRIYGTQNDLCSKGFQEIFTLGGNSFGAPCQFPFKYGDNWYSECTKDARADGLLWCGTDRDYDKSKKWGFCPTKGHSLMPVTGAQYQRNLQSALTWHQARKSCQQQGADLLSIVELHEQSYISGLTSHLGAPLWIGLNSLTSETGWQWSNGNPFRYLNWAPGHPSSEPGLSCATLNPAKASKWETSACSKKLGYICHRGNSTSLPPPPSKEPSFCPNHWVPYAGNCYYLERSKKMWKDALAACRKDEADLASIHNIEEQSFIISQSGYLPTDVLWIGLNDQRSHMLFEWSDNSDVTFTQWLSSEPSHSASFQEDCVLIRGKDGKWADHICEKTYGYICKKKGSTKPAEGIQEDVNPGCVIGSVRFGSYCYNSGVEAKTFEEAKQACSQAGASLVDITDRYENAFLVSLVGLRPEKYFWMGLSNTADKSTFKWMTRRKVTFTHFNAGMPDRHQGCVAMTTGMFAGLWDVISCSRKEKYICKKGAEGVHVTTVPPTTPTLYCASGWNPVAGRNTCYKYYKNANNVKKTWQESNDFCQAIGGNLMSQKNKGNDQVICASVFQRSYRGEPAWIGLTYRGVREGFVWSDGSAVSGFAYEDWGHGEPNNHNDNELCTEIQLYSGYGQYWNDRHCDAYNNWICQIRKGNTVEPKPQPVIVEPVYNKTDDGWLIYNDTQYFINNDKLAMENARAYCRTNFGDLAVITGESERKFLWKQARKAHYYIGMTVNLDKSFSWSDGTPVTYTAWERNEPNFANNDENCVTMYKSMGYWNDINCGLEFPSICKRSSHSINTTMVPTTVPKAGCAPEWLSFQSKCYKIVTGKDNKNWQDARKYCHDQGGNLVSILNDREQAFLTTQMLHHNQDLWIGMNDVNWEMHFVWTDGRAIKYTNWAKGHPTSALNGRYSMEEAFDCVMMVGSISKITGQWKVEDCNANLGFICKRNDSQIAVAPTTVPPNAFYKLGNDSYKLVAQKMRWDEARRQCQADDADLASIVNPVTQAYITLQISKLNQSVWIGLNNNVVRNLPWVDNWPLSYTFWGRNEPKHNYGCVYVDVDKLWKTAPCTNTYYSLCKKSTDIAPTEPPQLPGRCPESKDNSWIPFRGHCYSFFTSESVNWPFASVECLKLGASLLSIQDPAENLFIQQNLELLHDGAKSFWIGLYKTNNDDWMWIDNTVVDYTNWKKEMPKSDTCVLINSDSGQWSTNSCRRYSAFICKMPKAMLIDRMTAETSSIADNVHVCFASSAQIKEPSHGSAGIPVAVVLIMIALVGLAAFILLRKRIPSSILGESTFDNKLYFNNPIQAPVDAKGLVVNIEQNEQA